MNYEQGMVDREFEALGAFADARAAEGQQRLHTPATLDEQDATLGEASVYRFLRDSAFIKSRAALLQELRWLDESEVKVPAAVSNPACFASSRRGLVKALIRRFEFPAPGMVNFQLGIA